MKKAPQFVCGLQEQEIGERAEGQKGNSKVQGARDRGGARDKGRACRASPSVCLRAESAEGGRNRAPQCSGALETARGRYWTVRSEVARSVGWLLKMVNCSWLPQLQAH